MRRAGARGHAPQRGRPPSPFPGRPEGLTCSPPAPGPAARCALQGLPGSPSQEPCLAGSHLCPAGTRPRPLPDPGRASAVAEAGGASRSSHASPPSLAPEAGPSWSSRSACGSASQSHAPDQRGQDGRPHPPASGRLGAAGARSAACGPVSAHTQAPGARPSWRLQRQPAESGASVTGLPGDVPKRGLVALTWLRVQP